MTSEFLAAALGQLRLPVSLLDGACRIVYQNQAHAEVFGDLVGELCFEAIWKRDSRCPHCPLSSGVKAETATLFHPELGHLQIQSSLLAGTRTVVLETILEVPLGGAVAEQLFAPFANAETAIFLETLDGTVRGASRGAELLFGLSEGQFSGRNIREFLPEETLDQLPGILKQLQEQGSFRTESWQRRPDGSRFLADVEGIVFRRGPEPLVLVLVRDVTTRWQERKALEEQRQEVETFLHTVAHDLKTPLVSVKGYASLLANSLEEAEDKARDYADRVVIHTARLEKLLEDLMEYAKLGAPGDSPRDLDLGAGVERVWEDLRGRVEEAGATLDLAEPLGRVRMPPLHLTQVLTNLLSNALKYRRPDVPLVVRVERGTLPADATGAGKYHCLTVTDNGMGVPEGERDSIFGLFRQGTVSCGGSGVGLAIVQRIVERRGGKVWVEAVAEGGSRFFVTLPAVPGDGAD